MTTLKTGVADRQNNSISRQHYISERSSPINSWYKTKVEEEQLKAKYKVYKRKTVDDHTATDAWKEEQVEFERLFQLVDSLVLECHPEIALPVLNAICNFLPRYAGNEPTLAQSELELLQALFVRHNLSSFKRNNMDFDALIETTDALAEKFFKRRPSAAALFSNDSHSNTRDHFREKARTAEQFIRNWSQPDRMWEINLSLFSMVDDEFRKAYGVTASGLVTMLRSVTRNIDADVRRKIESNQGKLELTSFSSIKALYLDLCESFWLSANDFASNYPDDVDMQTMESILEKWTLRFGDLSKSNPEHLFMGNPVRTKPLIKHPDVPGYFLPFPQLLQTFCLEMIHSLVQDKQVLKKKYEVKRAQFLQNRLEKLIELNFPTFTHCANYEWNSNTENGEVDLLLAAEPLLLVVEAKSAKIEDTAKRGGDSLFLQFLKDVVVYSAIQMDRFETFITREPGVHVLTNKTGQAISIDSRLFSQIMHLTITLDTAYIQWDWERLRESGEVGQSITEPLVLSLADLETIFEVIPLEAEKLYYLQKRSWFQKQFDFFGDELDILGSYMDGHLPRRPDNFADSLIDFSACSGRLDRYFAKKALDPNLPKPHISRTNLWNQLLCQLDTKRPSGWVEASFLLLSIGHETQIDFENQLNQESAKLIASAKTSDSWHWPHEISTPEQSIGVWFALYKGLDFQKDLLPKLNLPLLSPSTAAIIAIDVTGKNEPIQTYIKRHQSG
ncbi:MAG: hypothetical protein WC028_30410 [Candidatus Obscuribacterales bacterium]